MWSPSHVASSQRLYIIYYIFHHFRETFLLFLHLNCQHHGHPRTPLHHQPHNNLLPGRDPRHPPSSLQRLSHSPPTGHNAPQNPPPIHLARLRRSNPFHSRRFLSLQLLLQLHQHQLRRRPRIRYNKQISPSGDLFPQRRHANLWVRIRLQPFRCFVARIRTRRPSLGRQRCNHHKFRTFNRFSRGTDCSFDL